MTSTLETAEDVKNLLGALETIKDQIELEAVLAPATYDDELRDTVSSKVLIKIPGFPKPITFLLEQQIEPDPSRSFEKARQQKHETLVTLLKKWPVSAVVEYFIEREYDQLKMMPRRQHKED